MKRILILFSLLCMIALMSVMANEGTNYTANTEPVLLMQVYGQDFGIGEFIGIMADPSKTDFSILSLEIFSYDLAMPEMSLSGSTRVKRPDQMIFVNFSPGIVVSSETVKRFLC